MSAAQGANHISGNAPDVDPRWNAAGYWDPFRTSGAGGGGRPAGQNALNPEAAQAMAMGLTSGAGAPVAATQPVAAAPIARTPTPQETLNQQYVPQLNAQMQKDPSNGYADQLKTLMNGQFSTSDPSYQWRFDQGQKAVERSVAARGLLNSGNAAIELQQYGQGMASQEYGAQFNRTLSAMGASESAFQASYNRLAELAGMTTGMQANSQNTNYNYSNLAERAQNNQQQIGLGYAGLAARTQDNQGQLAVQQGQLAVQQGQLLNQNRAANMQEQQYRDQKQAGENRDAAFKEVLTSRGVGSNGYDQWGNPVNPFVSVGTEDGSDASIYGGMSGYY